MKIFQIESRMPGPDPVSPTPSSLTPDNFIHHDIVNIKSLLFALKSILLVIDYNRESFALIMSISRRGSKLKMKMKILTILNQKNCSQWQM